jgi:Protein of unknown function (DUF2934)
MSDKSAATQMAPAQSAVKLVEPQTLLDRMSNIYEKTARRAFEIFENEGAAFGHDLEHWFKAEAELLHPVHVNISESGEALTVQAEVPGFNERRAEGGQGRLQGAVFERASARG